MGGPISEFDKRQGGQGLVIDDWVVFPNGAMRENSGYGALCEPPVDAYERFKVIVRYHEELLRLAVKNFNELKQHLTWLAKDGNGDPLALEKLKELRKLARAAQKEVDKARQQLDQNKPAALRHREEGRAVANAQREQFKTDLEAIKL